MVGREPGFGDDGGGGGSGDGGGGDGNAGGDSQYSFENVIQNDWGYYKHLLFVKRKNNNVNLGLPSIFGIVLVKEHILQIVFRILL